jgi:hypothetical protein
MLLLLYNPINYEFVDFSLGEGLAGLLSELLRLKQIEGLENDLNIDINQFLKLTVDSLLYFQNDLGYWKRQILIDQNWEFFRYKITSHEDLSSNLFFWSFFPLIILFIFKLIRKGKISR